MHIISFLFINDDQIPFGVIKGNSQRHDAIRRHGIAEHMQLFFDGGLFSFIGRQDAAGTDTRILQTRCTIRRQNFQTASRVCASVGNTFF